MIRGGTLRRQLRRRGIIKSVGIYDVFSAKLAVQAGFQTLFLGGFGASASQLGEPDLNYFSPTQMADLIRRITSQINVPLIADGDTGHGGVHNVARTVTDYEAAGAAGIILEDQVYPKRCGHFDGKSLVPVPQMQERLRAATAARKRRDFVIIARTDARAPLGLKKTIQRARTYYKTGADMVFVEAPQSLNEIELIPKKIKAPLLMNMLSGGKTPLVTLGQVERWGYKIGVYPTEALLAVMGSLSRLYGNILSHGIPGLPSGTPEFTDLKNFLGLPERLKILDLLKLTAN